jgi:uncharacterized protein (DUF488 family)
MTPLFTIGHSTRDLATLVALLRAHGVVHLVDVRTIPRSARNPQFNRETLPEPLAAAGIAYVHMKELGGLRRPRKDSINTAWRNTGFRGYADYMQTPEFERALGRLLERAADTRLAIMCAEAPPWRCHRSLISDALVVRGVRVEHILGPGPASPHALTRFARVEGTRVTYPEDESQPRLSGTA